jgi:hypothetical protein
MALITLIGKPLATSGYEFYYLGPAEECEDCKFKKVCFNLEEGAKYRVVSLRSQDHECHEFDSDTVTAVEVEKLPTTASVGKRQALEGSKITYKNVECKNVACPNYQICHPIGKVQGTKYTVQKVNGDLDCPLGEKLVSVDLF